MNISLDDAALSTFNTAQITDKSEETFKTDLWKVMFHSSLLVKQDILLLLATLRDGCHMPYSPLLVNIKC